MTTLRWAADEVARTLDQLSVRRVFIVPGNNDIVSEDVNDARRFDCFLSALQNVAKTLPLGLQLTKLDPDSQVQINGIHLAGLNTASFKDVKNYSAACRGAAKPADAAMLREACPQSQSALLRKFNAAGPLLLFTHVPNLKDPYRKSPSWMVVPELQKVWEQEVCAPAMLAVFAGHFHDSNRALYGSNTATNDLVIAKCVADKTWVAPPLAAKNQTDKSPQARGFLLATVTSAGVQKVEPIWYEPPRASPSPCQPCGSSVKTVAIPRSVMLALSAFVVAVICLVLFARQGWSQMYRDLNALAVVVAFFSLVYAVVWLVKSVLGISDSATLIALLILPLLVYGIASGRLTEFSAPGGWAPSSPASRWIFPCSQSNKTHPLLT